MRGAKKIDEKLLSCSVQSHLKFPRITYVFSSGKTITQATVNDFLAFQSYFSASKMDSKGLLEASKGSQRQ